MIITKEYPKDSVLRGFENAERGFKRCANPYFRGPARTGWFVGFDYFKLAVEAPTKAFREKCLTDCKTEIEKSFQ